MYPAGEPPKADSWTTGHVPEGRGSLPQGRRSLRHRTRRDQRQRRYRRRLLPSRSAPPSSTRRVTSPSRPTRCVRHLEYYKKLISFLPPDAGAWDDASNNKWLVSGRGALIMNPPSAWAVAKRDAPQVAEQCWTHGFPAGPKGRFAPYLPYFWSIWKFSKNKEAAKSLLAASFAAGCRSRRWCGERRLRPARLRKAHHAEGLGRRKGRRRARSITTRTRTTIRRCRSPRRPPRRRSPSRSTRRPR